MRRFLLVALVSALAAPNVFAAGNRSPFSQDENARLYAVRSAATEDERVSARRTLAKFYADNELHVETLAALGQADDDEARLLRASAELGLQRNDAVLETLADERLTDDATAAALRAVALARLGAFEAARAEFARATPSASGAAEFFVLKGETARALGDIAGARAALSEAGKTEGAAEGDLDLLSAGIAAASGEPHARETYRRLAKSESPRVAAVAALRLFAVELKAGALSPARARKELAALRLRWSGAAFDRELLEISAAAEKDIGARVEALSRLAREHSRSDAATAAQAELHAALRALLDDETRDAREVARLFYASVEFAPRGAEGDAMVRALATRLTRLDLLKEAAELLEHQVFKRLRGVERSIVAADLAQLHLDDRRPSEALRVLRATRFAGLDAANAERRRLLEATALERTGEADAALQLLADAGGSALDLRADIAWRSQRWPEAAASYRALLDGAERPLSERGREALLRAGAAYLLANDGPSYAAFRTETAERFGAFPEQELLGLMSLDGDGSGAKLLDAYRQVFSES